VNHRRRLLARLALPLCGLLAASTSAWAEAPRPAVLIKGPYLTTLSESGVDVRFELSGASPASVDVVRDGADAGAPQRFEDHAAVAMHVVHTAGLAPGTPHSYLVRVGGSVVGRGRFVTAPSPDSGAPLSFAVYGDTRSDPTAHAAVVRALAGSSCDFLVNTGDLVADGGSAADWQSFFDIEGKLLAERPVFVVIGNHELTDGRAGASFARYFGFKGADDLPHPYGTVRLSNVRFFFLNAMHDWGSGQERQWLEQELGRADTEPGIAWRIAVMHQGPWSAGPHGGSATMVESRLPQLLAAHGVDIVFSGHDHIYERGDAAGLKYVVSGGGGAPLYRLAKIATTHKAESTYHYVEVTTSPKAMRLVAYRIDGSLIDQCGFTKGGTWDCDAPPVLAEAPPAPVPPAQSVSRTGWGCAVRGRATRTEAWPLPALAAIAVTRVRRGRKRG
jgi:acid phosphatase type 7